MQPRPEILVFDNAEGVSDAVEEPGGRHVPDIERNTSGMPLIRSLFQKAEALATHDKLCYVNGDIILLQDFVDATCRLDLPLFLAVGRRVDLDVPDLLAFENDWDDSLRTLASERGSLHGDYGIDYFVFPKGLVPLLTIPDYPVGRPCWDNWLIYRTRALGIPVIDMTSVVLAIHQDHDYSHHPDGIQGVHYGSDATESLSMAGGRDYLFSIGDATLTLTPHGLRRNRQASLRRRLRTFSLTHQWLGAPLRLIRGLLRPRAAVKTPGDAQSEETAT